MFDDDAFVPISALQHLLYCERQCALIHIERQWVENHLTLEGRQLHERAHDAGANASLGVPVARGLSLRSRRLGLTGQADIVEFRQDQRGEYRQPFPVEYKRGRPKAHDADAVQLCAQALCLEEMLDVTIPAGALFYGQPRRRTEVLFDERLRALTETTARRLHDLLDAQRTPPARYDAKRCDRCSLLSVCIPPKGSRELSASRYLTRAVLAAVRDDETADV